MLKAWQHHTLAGMAGLCVLGVIALILLGRSSQSLQATLQNQQQEIDRGLRTQQQGNSLLQDITILAPHNARLRDVLKKNGFTAPAPIPTPTATGGK